jgi:branched-chain amino acid transport system substrate-binding protein
MRRCLKLTVVIAVVALVAAVTGSSAIGQTTTTTAGSTVPGVGPTTNGNAKAAKAVKNVKLVGTAGSGLTRGVTATSVKVGCYLQQASFSGADAGFKARFSRANSTKEIPGGRTIDFSACKDDGSNPQTNLQIVQSLVQQDQVFAVVGMSADVLPASTDFMNTNQVPFFGWGFLPGFCHTRWGFGFDGCLITADTDSPKVYQANLALGPIEAAGLKNSQAKVALQTGDDDSGHISTTTIGELYKLEGATVVYSESNIPVPGPPASFTPFVTAILAAKPNILETLVSFASAPGLTASMTAAGFTGTNINFVGYVPGLLASSAQLAAAFNGAYVSSQTVPQEAQTAYIKQMETDLTSSNAATGKFITLSIALAYAQADELVSMLKAVGSTLNTKTFDAKINNGNYTYKSSAEGGQGQMEFPAMHHIAADCAAVLKINGPAASFVPTVPFTCYDSPVVKTSKKN